MSESALSVVGGSYGPGVYPHLTNEEYHAAPGISNSGLLLVGQAPARYYGQRLDPNQPAEKQKAGQLEGTLVHCALFEPREFDARYVVGPTLNRNTKAWKEFAAANPERVAIQQDQHDMAMRITDSVQAVPDLREAFARPGGGEQSAFWIDEETGELCKCRPDWVAEFEGGDILFDAKTYSSAEPWEFSRQIARKGYHQQDQMYTHGWAKAACHPVLAFVFIAIELEHPHIVTPVMLDDESKAAGYQMYRRNLETYAECRQHNKWPGYVNGIAEISLPAWATK